MRLGRNAQLGQKIAGAPLPGAGGGTGGVRIDRLGHLGDDRVRGVECRAGIL